MRWSLFLLAAVALSACNAETKPEALETASAPIIGGSTEYGWPAVGALVADYDYYGYQGSFCTGTLIDDQWVLTAAHCVTGEDVPSTSETYFFIGTDARAGGWSGQPDGDLYPVERFYAHPDWDDETTSNDIALVKLASRVTDVTPVSYNTAALSDSIQGQPVTYVGFGVTDGTSQTGGGLKRSATIDMHMFYDAYYVGRYDGTGVCFGDSGGPGLYQFGDQWLIIGVNSSVASSDPYGDPCEGWYYHTRVDAFADWVSQYVAGVAPDCNDTPSLCTCDEACQADGSCNNDLCTSLDCSGVMACIYACDDSDTSCRSNCVARGTYHAQQVYEDMVACFSDNCTGYSGDAWQNCAYENCGGEIDACWPPAECDIRGGDCGTGEACYPTASGATDCYPSDGLGEGASCDPDLGDRLACGDGLLCLTEGGASSCYAFCLSDGDCGNAEGCQAPVFNDLDDIGVCQCTDYDNDGYCAEGDDCNDHDAAAHPGLAEDCGDGIDNDCDGATDGADPDCGGTCTDYDNDGHCAETDDCDDTDARAYEGATETCDGTDNDCDGTIDEGCPTCTDADQDGYCVDEDCHDGDAATYPGAVEACFDAVDNDCDGQTDEGCEDCVDQDNDGYCNDVDCDDSNDAIHPGARDMCGDGVDGDCDGTVDDGCNAECETDEDGDGYCAETTDCDDGRAEVNPGRAELCGDYLDNNCDGEVNEDCNTCADADQDGYCAGVDCNDKNSAIFPGGYDLCDDGVDGDCDGQVDEGCPEPCVDWDHDGYCDFAECNDADSEISPALDEVCDDGKDNDCDGETDEGCPSGNDSGDSGDATGGGGCSQGGSGAPGAPVLLFLLLGGLGVLQGRARRFARAPR